MLPLIQFLQFLHRFIYSWLENDSSKVFAVYENFALRVEAKYAILSCDVNFVCMSMLSDKL